MIGNLLVVAALALLPACQADLNFQMIADWGGQTDKPFYNAPEMATARAMDQYAAANGTDFVLALGDNFYEYGCPANCTSRFEGTFEKVFAGDHLNVPFYVVYGNHDYISLWKQQEIEYTNHSSRWNFPSTHYLVHKEFTVASGRTMTADILMIDTVLLAGPVDATDRYAQPSGPEDEAVANGQWAWIDEQLANSKADFLFVGGHYPIYSVCTHGPTQILIDYLLPRLHRANATAYLSGHDHCQEHLVAQGVNMVLSGAAHGCCYSGHADKVPEGVLVWAHAGGMGGANIDEPAPFGEVPDAGFSTFRLSEEGATIQFVNAANEVQHSLFVPPRSS